MKELSIKEKAKRYDKAIEITKSKIKNDKDHVLYEDDVMEIFPELAESEDERIRKSILEHIQLCSESIPNRDIWIAWLEKQGAQKPVDKVEPKFKVGDWVVYNRNDHSREVIQIYDIRDNRYYFNDNIHFSWSVKECDEKSHLWTIQDAKEGEILVGDSCIFIIQKFDSITAAVKTHCTVYDDGDFDNGTILYFDIDSIKPATVEQCVILLQKMKENGYKWDADKRKLKNVIYESNIC